MSSSGSDEIRLNFEGLGEGDAECSGLANGPNEVPKRSAGYFLVERLENLIETFSVVERFHFIVNNVFEFIFRMVREMRKRLFERLSGLERE